MTIYPTKKLGEVLERVQKIPSVLTRNYLRDGKYPIVDQGQFLIGGYTNDLHNLYQGALPIIVFGDHTRAVKFIDFPFAVGADGTKILKPIPEIDTRYFYFFLQSIEVPARGYARHFSLLKEFQIPLPPIAEQKKIVAKLEKVLGKIREAKKFREEAESAAKALLPAELHRIFTHPTNHNNTPHKQHTNKLEFIRMSDKWEEKELGEVFVLNYGKGLSRLERSEDGRYIVYGANGELGRSDKYLIEGDGIIIGRKGSAGEITRASGRYWPTDVTYFVTVGRRYDIGFAYYLFKFLNFPQYAAGVKPGINRNQIYEIKIPLPPIAEQKKIVARLDALSDKIRILRQAQAKTAADFTALEQSILSKSMSNK
jgi:type I restriction enzyme, S subunit